MYQENELQKLYERLKAQYPQYQLDFSGDSLTLNRLYCKVEVRQSGAKLYVNGNLYDQFTSEYVDDPDDLYELIEAFLLDLQHAGMKQGNETYIAATKQAAKMGSRFPIGTAMCFTLLMIGLIAWNSPWLFLLILLLPAASLLILKQMQKKIFQRCWICPACGQPLPMGGKGHSCEMAYVAQCPHCAHVLEQPPKLAAVQTEYAPPKPLEPPHDLPTPGSKWPCMITGGITIAFALLLLPLIFIPDGNEPLDMAGVWTGVGILLYLLGFGLTLLLCRHVEPEETQQPLVIVRERMVVTVLGVIVWVLGFVLTLMGVIVAGTPPFEPDVTAFVTVPGVPLFLMGVWMILAGRNRSLSVFQDNSILYISSWGRKREFAPGQVASVRLTANRSIHLRNKDGKKLVSIETNMRGIPRFAEWLESTHLAATLTPAMEKQTRQEEQQENTVQWREEYHTHWHDHIKSIRIGLWVVIVLFAIGVLVPIPLYLFADAKFTAVMKIGALAPVPFLLFCLVFAPVLSFGDKPQNATPEWRAMHIHVPLIICLLIGYTYFWQVSDIWGDLVLREADGNWGWLIRILSITIVLVVLQVLRSPKRNRVAAGLYMGVVGLSIACGLHYCVNAALIGPAQHYPAVIVDSHAEDPDVDDDDYTLTIVMDNGEETDLVVTEKVYEMAMNSEPLEICHRESPFGVVFLGIHMPSTE
ncbi:hypothetical protein [Parablautia sp. Marseille-Q6255]|uniref:hypothetical protein n=1 Tax=Parablautia sp. Marseille-Q6255 TaxID=3039593 RepID=UPI0024BC2FDC|nr:hypothetical protein [Parablautia sp. Marseille-Q6255]